MTLTSVSEAIVPQKSSVRGTITSHTMVQISCNITSVRRKKLHQGPEVEVGKVMTKEREGEEMRRPRCR